MGWLTVATIIYYIYDQDVMSLNLYGFIYYSIILMKEYVVWNVAWLTKFSKGEHVLTDWVKDANWEVKVYKLDCDWEILVNENGNKVNYSLSFNRLKPTDIECQLFTAGTLEARIMNKTFTDEKLDEASEYGALVTEFANDVNKLKVQLGKIANNLLGEVNDLTISADAYDADAFKKAMEHMKALVVYLKDKPMKDIQALKEKLVAELPEETYDPASVLN